MDALKTLFFSFLLLACIFITAGCQGAFDDYSYKPVSPGAVGGY